MNKKKVINMINANTLRVYPLCLQCGNDCKTNGYGDLIECPKYTRKKKVEGQPLGIIEAQRKLKC